MQLADGRTLQVYDSGGAGAGVVWDNGAPPTRGPPAPPLGEAAARGKRPGDPPPPRYWGPPPQPRRGPLAPLLEMAAARGMRLVTYARPGYGDSTPQPWRDVAAAAADVAELADALGIERFVTLGASGGGPHALACAALLPDRVTAVATL